MSTEINDLNILKWFHLSGAYCKHPLLKALLCKSMDECRVQISRLSLLTLPEAEGQILFTVLLITILTLLTILMLCSH